MVQAKKNQCPHMRTVGQENDIFEEHLSYHAKVERLHDSLSGASFSWLFWRNGCQLLTRVRSIKSINFQISPQFEEPVS